MAAIPFLHEIYLSHRNMLTNLIQQLVCSNHIPTLIYFTETSENDAIFLVNECSTHEEKQQTKIFSRNHLENVIVKRCL